MAINSLEGLFSTPAQVRALQEQQQRQKGLSAAELLLAGTSPRASSALPGLLQSFGANIASNIDRDAQNLVRRGAGGLGSFAGAAGKPELQQALMSASRSPEETQAMKMQARLKKAQGDYQGLKALGEELMREGNAKEAYAVLQLADSMAPDASGGMTNDIKNILFYAKNELKCDINDPECIKEARDIYIETKRADTAEQKMEVTGYDTIVAARDEAQTNVRSMERINTALQTLDESNVNLGSFANTRQGAIKLASQLFGWKEGAESVENTALLMAQTKALAGELLASGMLGTGTAISDRDLETVKEIAGAAESLTPESMRKILEYNSKMNKVKIDEYNERLNKYSDSFYARTPEGRKANFRVYAPELYMPKEQPQDTMGDVEMVPFTEGEVTRMVPVGAQIGTYKGQRGYLYEGKFIPFEDSGE